MTITTTAIGANSFRIDYSETDSASNILNALHNKIIECGQSAEDDAQYTVGSFVNTRVYSILNTDGITKKYVKLSYRTGYLHLCAMYSYDKFNKTGIEFITCPTTTYNTYGALHLNIGAQFGTIYLFINPKQFILHCKNGDGTVGTVTESGFIGVCEAKVLHVEDVATTYPCYGYFNSYTLLGHHHSTFYATAPYYMGVIDFYSCKNEIANGNAVKHSQIITPRGTQGDHYFLYSANTYSSYYQYQQADTFIASTPDIQSNNNYCYDIGIILNAHTAARYFKGNLYGLKILNSGIGTLGDIVKLKVDSDQMMDSAAATTTDFVLLTNGAFRFGIPA